ncbi:MAG: hypothetical protein II700_06555 [Firmicutes bacterium]|nr:hypothetical protein [Bacillota bacterium]MBQ4234541.1 hypothetical protein [Bacillota bacterium]MBQ6260046.1 hypothetical protein [Bacillota bacterium]
MLPIIILKGMGDLAFYYSFAGFFAVKFGADPSMLLITLMIQTAAFAASFMLEEKGRLRFLPPALTLLCLLLPGLCPAFALAVLPGLIYLYISAKDRTYYPTWASAADLLSLFTKAMSVFALIILVMRGSDALMAISLPCAVICLCCCVMLTRSMRHDIDVYTSPMFQAVTAGTAVLLVIFSAAVSSRAFRAAVSKAVGAVYLHAIVPVLLSITQLIVYIFYLCARVISWILKLLRIEGAEVPDYETIYGESGEEILQDNFDPNGHPILRMIASICLILLALYGAYRLFRYMQGMVTRRKPEDIGERETRSFISDREEKTGAPNEGLIDKLRAQYRSFLKTYRKLGLPLEKHMTSENILTISSRNFDPEEGARLRELYIRARYGGIADKDDVAKAKELVKSLKKNKED